MISKHLASLPAPGEYARGWRKLVALPPNVRVKRPGGWGAHSVISASELRRELLLALDRRINIRGGNIADNDPIEVGWIRDARRLEDIKVRRVRVYQFERPEVRAKFGHLLASHDD